MKSAADLQRQHEAQEAAKARFFQLEMAHWKVEGKLKQAEGRTAQLDSQLGVLRSRLAERGEKLSASEKHGTACEEQLVEALAQVKQQQAELRGNGNLQEVAEQMQRALASSQEDNRLQQVTGRSPRDPLPPGTPPTPGDPPYPQGPPLPPWTPYPQGHGLTGQAGG